MICPKCFRELEPNQKFCPYCGTMITEPAPAPAEASVMNENLTATADIDDIPAHQSYQPEEQPAWSQPEQPAYQAPEQPAYQAPEQPAYQPPEQPAGQPVPPYQGSGQPYQPDPVSPKKDFSQQFQQYQQGSGMPGTRQGDGSLPPDKNKTPLIIAIVIAAVVLIGAAVFAAVWIFGGCDKKSDSSSSSQSTSAVSTTTKDESSNLTSDTQSSQGSSQTDDSTNITESSKTDDSSNITESSKIDDTSAPMPVPGSATEVVNRDGLKLAEDPDIDSGDSYSQEKINGALKASNMPESIDLGVMTVNTYAEGNVLVYEYKYTEPISSEDRATVIKNLEELPSKSTATLSSLRTQTGVANMIMVYAYVDSDGTLVSSVVCK